MSTVTEDENGIIHLNESTLFPKQHKFVSFFKIVKNDEYMKRLTMKKSINVSLNLQTCVYEYIQLWLKYNAKRIMNQ